MLFLRSLGRLIVLLKNTCIISLGCHIGLVDLFSELHSVCGRAINFSGYRPCHINFRMIPKNILYRIVNFVRNSRIVEDDRIILFIERKVDRYRSLVRYMSGNRRSIFCNLIPLNKIRIGYDLIIQNFCSRTHLIVMNSVTYRVLCPMSIESNIVLYWLIPVIEGTSLICCSKPSLERIMSLSGICRFFSIETILFCLRCNIRTSLRVVCYRTGRESECTIKNKTCRHLGTA